MRWRQGGVDGRVDGRGKLPAKTAAALSTEELRAELARREAAEEE